MRIRLSLFVLSCAVVAAAVFGCGSQSQPSSSAHSGFRALHTLVDIDGKPLGQARADSKGTLVVFFATWCGPCRKELEILSRLRKEHPKVRVIGLNAYEDFRNYSDSGKLRTFLASSAPWLRVAPADASVRKSFGGVPKIPSLFVFNQQGKMIKEFRRDTRSPPSEQELARALEKI
jgi:thiol-disulfide isomerase/thioredoxin